MGLRSEFIALIFGMLLVLVTFGDNHIVHGVGNLDTVLGLGLWHALDVFYPVASIVIFLLYGLSKGNGFRINLKTVLLFGSFVLVLGLFSVDDIFVVLNIPYHFSIWYWFFMMIIYPVYSMIAFSLFGRLHEKRWNKI